LVTHGSADPLGGKADTVHGCGRCPLSWGSAGRRAIRQPARWPACLPRCDRSESVP